MVDSAQLLLILRYSMFSFARDVRYGARLFWKAPGFSAVALVALALGMGATTAIFSVVNAVLLKPLPFRDPDRLLVVWEKNPAQNKFRMFVAAGNFVEWRQARSFEDMAAVRDFRTVLTGGPNGRVEPEEIRAERVSASLFSVLGVQARVGRTFRAEEDQPGRTTTALISHRLWQERFGADPSIAGKQIRLQDTNYTIDGVLPAGFGVIDPMVDVWVPLGLNTATAQAAAARNLMVIARLKPGCQTEQARSEMETIGDRLEHAYPALNAGYRPSLFELRNEFLGATGQQRVGTVEQALRVLMAAVGALLLMACVNVANLLLARGVNRRKEIAIRTALGASSGRIMVQLLTESVLLALTGGLIGLALAEAAVRLVANYGPAAIPRLSDSRLDLRIFLSALCVSVATGVLFGLVPAIQVMRANSLAALSEGGRGGTMSRSSRAVRNGLVVAEIAIAVVVLIGAGLLIRSFVRLRGADPGFQSDHLLTLRIPLTRARGATPELRAASFQQISDRLAALPGVRGVGAVNSLPLTDLGMGDTFTIQGQPIRAGHAPLCLIRSVTIPYFRVMGIPHLEGRQFDDRDTAQSPKTVVVNQTLARRFRPASALGGHIVLANLGAVEIVGVVGDVKADRMDAGVWPTVYFPFPQAPVATMYMVVRTTVPPLSIATAVEREVTRFDPDQPVADLRPMEAVVDQSIASARFNTAMLGVFAVIAFALSAVGIYGVISYDVNRRVNEIGLRMALGAQPGDVLRLVMRQGALLAAGGVLLGLAAAFGCTRLMESMLYGVQATDLYTFAGIALLLAGVALAATYLPSRRAMGLDPVTALRHE
jgi:putative ABC transport system permease protein